MARIPINIATGTLQKEDIIVGIDLGTTNSLIAIMHPDTQAPVALKEFDGSTIVPSIIHIDANGNFTVGADAKPFLLTEPERTIFSVKRLMGKSYKDVGGAEDFFTYKVIDDNKEGLVKIQVGKKFYSPIDLSALILKELKKRAEHILKTPVNRAVITVPAYFNDTQRQATRDAGKIAGLDVLRIINEPTAASLAYGLGTENDPKEKIIAVYDFGGGTFDISILRLHAGIFEVLSTHGDTYLGGDDMDRAILKYWMKETGLGDALLTDKKLLQAFRLKAEEAKCTLTSGDLFEGNVEMHKLQLSRAQFEGMIQPIIDKTIKACGSALKDAELKTSDIDSIIMVGGSTRVPLVKSAVSAFFGKPVFDKVNPEEVVALGAAVQGDILSGNNKTLLLLDVTPLSLGVETSGGLMDVLVPRNSKIPNKASRQYTTQIDGQGGMRISVFQGERDLIKDNRKLAEFNLTNIPSMPAGMAKVEISFLINADGILTVSAKELRSGVSQEIEVKPQYGLSDEDVEKMLLDSMTFAEEDIAARALAEAETEGEQILKTTERFLQKNANSLTKKEMMQTAEAMQALQLSLTMKDKDLIQAKTTELNDISRPYAERIMDQAVAGAMKGKSV